MKGQWRLFGALFLLVVAVPTTQAEKLMFTHEGQALRGVYDAPEAGTDPKGVILFVHGDGAMPHEANGYYDPIQDQLRALGYAVFSWDKPGVGKSQGNWLQQSMADRQAETEAAIRFIKRRFGYSTDQVGLLGFSQAGWVVPELASRDDLIGFAMGIGFAVNWVEQGEYYTRTKSRLEQASGAQSEAALAHYRDDIAWLNGSSTYEEYRSMAGDDAMNEDRFYFVRRNFRSDATDDYMAITVPTLLLWGEEDLNVDASTEYRQILSFSNRNLTLFQIPEGTHALLDASRFDQQSMGTWQWLTMIWLGEDAFASEFFPTLNHWLSQRD